MIETVDLGGVDAGGGMNAGESFWNLYALLADLRSQATEAGIQRQLYIGQESLKTLMAYYKMPEPVGDNLQKLLDYFAALRQASPAPVVQPEAPDRTAGKTPRYDRPAKSLTSSGEQALELCNKIISGAEELEGTDLGDGQEFVNSVRAFAEDVKDRTEKYGNASEKQINALQNQWKGLQSWLDRRTGGGFFTQEDDAPPPF